MSGSLLNIHLNDDQIAELNSALCAYRDHFVELIESNDGYEGFRARENDAFWRGKVASLQDLIDQINRSLYGIQPHAPSTSEQTLPAQQGTPMLLS